MDHDLKLVSSVPVQPFKPSWIPLASHPGRAVTLFLGQKKWVFMYPKCNRHNRELISAGPQHRQGHFQGQKIKSHCSGNHLVRP